MINQSLEKQAKECEVKFKIALLKQQITQREMANMLGTGPQQINRAIKGDTSPLSNKLREKMEKKLGIND
ncbi:helix-turn-helix domain-containing protein [Lactobacillus huangpiensis]|uniref:helix-turn-helix domain-containing protein n=1 Tax=Lactobacillus huangpiensis TaxID=2799571 RepID=UPI001CC4D99B|nr:helix-turn-helix transcriptional regulator [Lactobacillus huangpiensis]